MLQRILRQKTILHSTILHYKILQCPMLCYAILCSTKLYYTETPIERDVQPCMLRPEHIRAEAVSGRPAAFRGGQHASFFLNPLFSPPRFRLVEGHSMLQEVGLEGLRV